jgi:CheY-like chemotaxis protein
MHLGAAGLILHVDDEPSVRDSMLILLRADGYAVSSAASGTEAFQLVSEGFLPDVLIVDLNLGQQMNGLEVAEEIQKKLSYTPPIIILTGDVSHAKFPRVAEVVIWLTRKPLNPQLLLAALPSLVQLSRTTRKLPSRSA